MASSAMLTDLSECSSAWLERYVRDVEVASSNLVTPTIFLILRRPDLRSAFSFPGVNLRVNYAIYDSERIPNLRNPHCVSQRLAANSPARRGRRLLLRRSKGRENTRQNPTSPFLMPNLKFSACEKINHNMLITKM